MSRIGLSVPPGLTITTDTCAEFHSSGTMSWLLRLGFTRADSCKRGWNLELVAPAYARSLCILTITPGKDASFCKDCCVLSDAYELSEDSPIFVLRHRETMCCHQAIEVHFCLPSASFVNKINMQAFKVTCVCVDHLQHCLMFSAVKEFIQG